MRAGAIAFEISDIQEDESEAAPARRSDITMLHRVENGWMEFSRSTVGNHAGQKHASAAWNCYRTSRIFRSKNQRCQILGGYVLRIEFSQKRWEMGMRSNRLLPKSFAFSDGKNPPSPPDYLICFLTVSDLDFPVYLLRPLRSARRFHGTRNRLSALLLSPQMK